MISFWRIFWLEFVSLVRSKTLAMLLGASVLWMLVFPHVVKGDGTDAGLRELTVHYSLGGVFALLTVVLLATATGSLARERAAKRLQLTMIRPVRYVMLIVGKLLAQALVGAIVLTAAAAVLLVEQGAFARCHHVLRPTLPTPQEEARDMYAAYMDDPATPETVRKAPKSAVLRLLAMRAIDHYQTIPTNETVQWTFPLDDALRGEPLSVQMRFTNQYEMRQEVRGEFALGDFHGSVSNVTQAVLTVPLQTFQTSQTSQTLSFFNGGTTSLMLRPRRDICLLVRADSFAWNLVRAVVEMTAVLTFVIAAGLFLSAGLGRSVALFVAFVSLAVSEMGPSVLEQYPNELDANLADRIGLCLTRVAAEATRPFSAASPIQALAKDECIERRDVWRVVLTDAVVMSVLLAFLAAYVLPRKE